ncbi:ABC transporter ATP-binding protein [Terrisporobacter mayombei]|uniref:Multidrug export ATP-binding/permease protein n=1 Tax=Terrisporobacter mayombei TaxID=1541 RepID=A0ABY9Q7V4_9FIRM|nr:ABC transporter ATP-binding protein [Terrisporobacter mayombei]MCC3869642.1 ABC transporter ATP-binding protein/permease [Terrisporobacter mayombei]WMT83419.1 Putative multidrug export ATP-binding/permease protein [Terrisporobacter mayombei]
MNFMKKVIQKIKEGLLQEMWKEAKWMWQYINRYKFAVFFYLILGILSTVMGLAGSVLSKYLIDAVTGVDKNNLGWIIGGIVGMGVGGIIINAITSRISTKISIKVNNEIRQEAYDKVMRSDWLSMTNFHSGDILNRLNGDVSTVSGSVVGWIPSLITKTVQFIGALAIILYYDPTMAILALISTPIMMIVSKLLMTKMRYFNKKSREVSSEVMAFNEESFQNIQSIKAFDLIGHFNNKLINMQNKYKEVSLDYNKFSIATSSFMSLVGMLVSYSCFGWGVYRLWTGHITYGTMTLFLQLSGTLSGSFNALVGMVPSAISATTSAGRLMDFFKLPNEELLDDEKIQHIYNNTKDQGLTVELDNVMFNYDENKVVFENASIVANPGEIVALVGPSGEGKTTMVRILLALINIKKGKAVLRDINGIECNISADSRRFFAYVPQGNAIFSGTIADNMRMVKEDAKDEEIINALETACAFDFVKQLPEGINSPVGEKGMVFSEGQAQRLSIARALLRKSPVLILDEATSALDVYTERVVLRNIMDMGYARTCIVTTHRPSVLNLCDRVYKIDKSTVSEIDHKEVEQLIKNF